MVRQMWQLLHKEWSSLHQAAFLLASTSLVSQLLGLVRDRLLAGTFGAGSELDIYYTAFRVPDLVYVSIASFVSVTVLIPFITSTENLQSRVELRRFLNAIFTVFTGVMVCVVVILWFLMPVIAPHIAPGFSPEFLDELIMLSRILLLSPLLLGVSNLFGGITQSFHKFFAFTISPIVYNVGIIAGILWLYPFFGLSGIIIGVIIGASLHLLVQLPSIYRLGLGPYPTVAIPWKDIFRIVRTSLPRTLTLATHQIVLSVLVAVGSTLTAGAVAVFTLAQNLQTVPIMIIGVSYSVAAFPTLAKLFSAGDRATFIEKIVLAARHITFWSMPAVVFIVVLRAHIVRVILGSGEFTWSDTRLTAATLALLVLCAGAFSLSQLFIRGYYAVGNTLKPLVINTVSSFLIVALSFFFITIFKIYPGSLFFIESLLRVDGLPGVMILALPLAFSLGIIANTLLFVVIFERDFGGLIRPLWRSTLENLTASVIAGFAIYSTILLTAPFLELTTLLNVFLQGLVAGLIGIITWLFILLLIKNQEFLESLTALRVKFTPKNRVITEQSEL